MFKIFHPAPSIHFLDSMVAANESQIAYILCVKDDSHTHIKNLNIK